MSHTLDAAVQRATARMVNSVTNNESRIPSLAKRLAGLAASLARAQSLLAQENARAPISATPVAGLSIIIMPDGQPAVDEVVAGLDAQIAELDSAAASVHPRTRRVERAVREPKAKRTRVDLQLQVRTVPADCAQEGDLEGRLIAAREGSPSETGSSDGHEAGATDPEASPPKKQKKKHERTEAEAIADAQRGRKRYARSQACYAIVLDRLMSVAEHHTAEERRAWFVKLVGAVQEKYPDMVATAPASAV